MLVDGWIDVHAHFSPPQPDEVREGIVELMHMACWCVDEPPVWSVASTLAYMDRTGIQMQMLSNIPKWLEGLRASNDYGASLAGEHPTRFGFLAALPTDWERHSDLAPLRNLDLAPPCPTGHRLFELHEARTEGGRQGWDHEWRRSSR